MKRILAALFFFCGLASGSAPAEAEFHAWVAKGYARRPDLQGWQATARLMARDWPGSTEATGSSADSLRQFLRQQAGRPAVIYLTAHRDPEGRLDLPEDGTVALTEVWLAQGTEGWTVVLDLCHARAAQLPGPAPACLVFTAASNEKTWELGLFSPRTSPLPNGSPKLASLRSALGPGWNGHFSAWGLGWALSSGPHPTHPHACQRRVKEARRSFDQLTTRRARDFRSTFSILLPSAAQSSILAN